MIASQSCNQSISLVVNQIMKAQPMETAFYVLVLVTGALGISFFNSKSGPYDVQVHKFEECPDPGTKETFFPTKLTRVDRNNVVYNETARIHPKVDSSTKVHLELQKKGGNGGYIRRYMEHTIYGCEGLLRMYENSIKKFFKSAGFIVNGCPIPAGNYTACNFLMDIEGPVPVMIYGSYRLIFTFFYGDRKIGCITGYGNLVPKSVT